MESWNKEIIKSVGMDNRQHLFAELRYGLGSLAVALLLPMPQYGEEDVHECLVSFHEVIFPRQPLESGHVPVDLADQRAALVHQAQGAFPLPCVQSPQSIFELKRMRRSQRKMI